MFRSEAKGENQYGSSSNLDDNSPTTTI